MSIYVLLRIAYKNGNGWLVEVLLINYNNKQYIYIYIMRVYIYMLNLYYNSNNNNNNYNKNKILRLNNSQTINSLA